MSTNLLPTEVLGDPMAPRSRSLDVAPAPTPPLDRPGAKRTLLRSPIALIALVVLLASIAVAGVMLFQAADENPRARRAGPTLRSPTLTRPRFGVHAHAS